MEVLESIISFLQFQMKEPQLYGVFHICSLVIMLLIIFLLFKKKPNVKKTLLVMSIIMLCFEVYKQLSFSYTDGKWEFEWYAFPFQFCSTPMYVAFLAGIVKNKKIEKNLYAFLAGYSIVGGLSVMLYPNTVFTSEVLINIQTMVHHGFMVIMGVYVLYISDIKLDRETILGGFKIFLILVLIALSIDIGSYYLNIDEGLEMFFISPYHKCSLPVYGLIYDKVPYMVFLFIYVISFGTGSVIPLAIKKALCKK